MSEIKYCRNCGSSTDGDKFCSNCGAEIAPTNTNPVNQMEQGNTMNQGGTFSNLGNFQAPQQPTMVDLKFEPYRGSNILQSTVDIYNDPERVSMPLLLDKSTPNPIIWVILYGVLAGILSYFQSIKSIVKFDDSIDDTTRSALENANTSIVSAVITEVISNLIVWWIAAWVLGSLMKGGFPRGTPLAFDATYAIRRLGAYRFSVGCIAILAQIIALFAAPDQTITYSTNNSFGVPLPEYGGFGNTYTIINALALLGYYFANLYLLKKVTNSLHYRGSIVNITIFFWSLFAILPALLTFGNLS